MEIKRGIKKSNLLASEDTMGINRETDEVVQAPLLRFMVPAPNLESFERYHSRSRGFGFVFSVSTFTLFWVFV
jgi:hypothetical protein